MAEVADVTYSPKLLCLLLHEEMQRRPDLQELLQEYETVTAGERWRTPLGREHTVLR